MPRIPTIESTRPLRGPGTLRESRLSPAPAPRRRRALAELAGTGKLIRHSLRGDGR